ncbi:MAG TPA: hypothetical protein PKE07_08175 [Lacibacter sp.]|nr:hypothetical protein [Lacibacter sp.]HMO89883.1 hypothetical protein [Lacibacter sp.]
MTYRFLLFQLFCCICITTVQAQHAGRIEQTVTCNGVSVQLVAEVPAADTVDVLLAYHGTVLFDSKILEAARNMLGQVKRITDRKDILLVSVAYPEEGLLMGDNIREAEAALLWVRQHGAAEWKRVIRKVFLVGHSQGGYLVTRLNTLHTTDGVIANAPGPLNMELRCQLEEDGRVSPAGDHCRLLRERYGPVRSNPGPYLERSLLSFTSGFKAPILFVQGLNDSRIQLTSWPRFRQQVEACTNCAERRFLEIPGAGHGALFQDAAARRVYNAFLNR